MRCEYKDGMRRILFKNRRHQQLRRGPLRTPPQFQIIPQVLSQIITNHTLQSHHQPREGRRDGGVGETEGGGTVGGIVGSQRK